MTTIGGVCNAFVAVDGCGATSSFGQLGELTVDSSGNIWAGDRGQGSAAARVIKGTPPAGATPLAITSISIPPIPPKPGSHDGLTNATKARTVSPTVNRPLARLAQVAGASFSTAIATDATPRAHVLRPMAEAYVYPGQS